MWISLFLLVSGLKRSKMSMKWIVTVSCRVQQRISLFTSTVWAATTARRIKFRWKPLTLTMSALNFTFWNQWQQQHPSDDDNNKQTKTKADEREFIRNSRRNLIAIHWRINHALQRLARISISTSSVHDSWVYLNCVPNNNEFNDVIVVRVVVRYRNRRPLNNGILSP